MTTIKRQTRASYGC